MINHAPSHHSILRDFDAHAPSRTWRVRTESLVRDLTPKITHFHAKHSDHNTIFTQNHSISSGIAVFVQDLQPYTRMSADHVHDVEHSALPHDLEVKWTRATSENPAERRDGPPQLPNLVLGLALTLRAWPEQMQGYLLISRTEQVRYPQEVD